MNYLAMKEILRWLADGQTRGWTERPRGVGRTWLGRAQEEGLIEEGPGQTYRITAAGQLTLGEIENH